MTKCLLPWFVILLLAACAPATHSPETTRQDIKDEATRQQELALERRLEEEQVVADIGYGILEANAPLCKTTIWTMGIQFWNKDSFSRRDYRKIAEAKYGLDKRLRIKQMYDGSPAIEAGLQRGDVLLAINDTKIPKGWSALKKVRNVLKKAESPDISVKVERDGQEVTKTLHMRQICDYTVQYDPHDLNVNAAADGKTIVVTRGMLRFVNTEQEMALVISHELAHNVMLHLDKERINTGLGQLAGIAVDVISAQEGVDTNGDYEVLGAIWGSGVYSVAFEQEADYVGMYFLERTGYSLDGVEDFWRRNAAEDSDQDIKSGGTHPGTAERYLAIAKTRMEIEHKKAASLPMISEFKRFENPETYLKTVDSRASAE